MASPGYVASTVGMGAFLLAFGAVLLWRGIGRPSVSAPGGAAATDRDEGSTPRLPGETVATTLYRGSATYVVAFVSLVVAVLGGSMLYLLGYDVGFALVGLAFVVLAGYVFAGVYWAARGHGRSSARAAAEGMTALVALLLVAVVVQLVLAG